MNVYKINLKYPTADKESCDARLQQVPHLFVDIHGELVLYVWDVLRSCPRDTWNPVVYADLVIPTLEALIAAGYNLSRKSEPAHGAEDIYRNSLCSAETAHINFHTRLPDASMDTRFTSGVSTVRNVRDLFFGSLPPDSMLRVIPSASN
jgi:hypothetical protein